MARSKPHTIRFNDEDYSFICKREQLKTAQSILDFLMQEYMKMFKVEKPSIFLTESEKQSVGNATTNFLAEEKKPLKIFRTFEQWKQMKIGCENDEDWAEISEGIRNSENLTRSQIQLLLN